MRKALQEISTEISAPILLLLLYISYLQPHSSLFLFVRLFLFLLCYTPRPNEHTDAATNFVGPRARPGVGLGNLSGMRIRQVGSPSVLPALFNSVATSWTHAPLQPPGRLQSPGDHLSQRPAALFTLVDALL
jgi:hypothetical protein